MDIYAVSGHASDIQDAVDLASAGDVVYVPEGSFDYPSSVFTQSNITSNVAVLIPGGVNVVGAGINKTVLQQTDEVTAVFFEVDGRNSEPSRISGISFKGNITDENIERIAIAIYGAKNFRIDHNSFDNFCGSAIFNNRYGYENRGVIDQNEFDNSYKEEEGTWLWGYGVNLQAYSFAWKPLNEIFGKYIDGTIYVEDNVFQGCRYAIAANTAAYYVFRYNDVTVSPLYNSFGKAGVDVHEGFSDGQYGGRGLEAYNNIIRRGGDYGEQGFKLRAGSGVIFNNELINLSVGVWLLKFGWAINEQNYVKDLYIWNNTYENVTTQLKKDEFYEENTHYFLYGKSGYESYPYPHPLTGENGEEKNTKQLRSKSWKRKSKLF